MFRFTIRDLWNFSLGHYLFLAAVATIIAGMAFDSMRIVFVGIAMIVGAGLMLFSVPAE